MHTGDTSVQVVAVSWFLQLTARGRIHHVELLLIFHLKKLIVASPYGTGMSFEPDLWTCSKSLGDNTSRPCHGCRVIPDCINP